MKIIYTPSIIDDKLIMDGLCAVATLSDNPQTKGSYFVVGGIATQSYLPTICRRPTADIDLAVLKPLTKEDFRAYSASVRMYLSDNGYRVSDRKFRRAFCLDFSDNEGKTTFISIPRHNEKSFSRLEGILARERENARSKIVEGAISSYVVASPEDIIVRKLTRAVNRLFRNPDFEKYISSMQNLTRDDIELKIKYLNNLREGIYSRAGSEIKIPEESEEFLRFLSDLFDIRILSELGGINKGYFNEAVKSWDTLTNPKNAPEHHEWQVGLITRAVLPVDMLDFGLFAFQR